MKGKRWIGVWFSLVITLFTLIPLFNYLIDPNWAFQHVNKWNDKQDFFNERQQKTNYLYAKGLEDFDGILLGSSRATNINQNEFLNMKIYNYSMSNLRPNEYKDYINFAKRIKKRDLKYIIIGADFFGTNRLKGTQEFQEPPSLYITNAMTDMNRYKTLFSFDSLKFSLKNIQNHYFGATSYYNRDNIKFQKKVSEEGRLKSLTQNIQRHTSNLMDENYEYDDAYVEYLRAIRRENPNSHFIIYTSPITADLLVSIIIKAKRMQEYERWLEELIDVFGEVHHFMTINSITTNLNNYKDDDHAYSYVVNFIANKISNKMNSNIPEDFGVILNETNLNSFLVNFKQEVRSPHPTLTLE